MPFLFFFFIHLRRDSHAISVTYLKYSTPCSNWAPINPLLQYMNSFFSYRRVSFSLLLSVGGWCCIVGCAVLIREPGHQSMPSAEPTSQLHIILLTNRYIGSYECIPTVENRAVERASQHHHHHLFSFLWSFLFLTTAGKDGSRFIIKKARVVNF